MSKLYPREPVEATPRQSFTPAQRDAVLKRAKSKCGLCNMDIGDEPFEIDHRLPLELKGKHAPSNWQPMHPRCHAIKTKADRARITKTKHQRAAHLGTRPKPVRKLQGRGFGYSSRERDPAI
jgi:5-methylcytosine-specific restriction protein A